MKKLRVLLELVSLEGSELKDIQQKINTWMTTELLVKFDTQVISDKAVLFRITLKKNPE